MPKQPLKRERSRKEAAQPLNSQGPEAAPAVFKSPANPKTGQAGPEKNHSEENELHRLLRSPLLPSQLNFVPPGLLIRGISLAILLFSYLGTLAARTEGLTWARIGGFSVCIAAIGFIFWLSTRRLPPVNRQIGLAAIAVEMLAAVVGLLVMGFSSPFYFTILPFYLVLGQIHAFFPTRPALALSGLWWLSLAGLAFMNSQAGNDTSFILLLLVLSIPFLIVTLVVRFIVREGRQRVRLMKALAELRVSEERYRQVTDQANDAIYILDSGGRFDFVNPTASELIGFEEKELLGRHFTEVLQPENRQIISRLLQDSL
jgi:PAS domain-containing protein